MAGRFRGFLPVVVDVETGGFNAEKDALLEIAAITLTMDTRGYLVEESEFHAAIEPFDGANLEQSALDFTGIDPADPERNARPETEALQELFQIIRREVKAHGCTRAIMVAHNAHFDQGFVHAAAERCELKRNPFHPFSCFDTATLSGLALGQTVLARSCQAGGIEFNGSSAHSALYDTRKTAELFCLIVNRWKDLGGWQS
ncbi:MAG: ribonuclease T [Pseudomonadota bacterium]